jgi:hypothetical protein
LNYTIFFFKRGLKLMIIYKTFHILTFLISKRCVFFIICVFAIFQNTFLLRIFEIILILSHLVSQSVTVSHFFLKLAFSVNWYCPQKFEFCLWKVAINWQSHLEIKMLTDFVNFLHRPAICCPNFCSRNYQIYPSFFEDPIK